MNFSEENEHCDPFTNAPCILQFHGNPLDDSLSDSLPVDNCGMMDERDKNILNYFQEPDHLDRIDNFQDCVNDDLQQNNSLLNEINAYSSFRNSPYENMSASSDFTSKIINTHQNPLGDLPFHSIGNNEERLLETKEDDILDFFLEPFHFEPADESHADLRQNAKDQPNSIEYNLIHDDFQSGSVTEYKPLPCSRDSAKTKCLTSVCTLGNKRKYLEISKLVKSSNFPEFSEFLTDRDENNVNAKTRSTKTYQIDDRSSDNIFSNKACLFSVPGGLPVAGTSRFNSQPHTNVLEKPVKDDEISGVFLKVGGVHDQNYQYADERPFACYLCSMRFKRKWDLKQHLVVHSEERPFKCDECGRGFKRKCNLTQHAHSHSQEKAFVCHLCSERFTRKSNLTRHLQVHSDETPFTCDQCGKTFKRKGDLKKHALTHSKYRNFQC